VPERAAWRGLLLDFLPREGTERVGDVTAKRVHTIEEMRAEVMETATSPQLFRTCSYERCRVALVVVFGSNPVGVARYVRDPDLIDDPDEKSDSVPTTWLPSITKRLRYRQAMAPLGQATSSPASLGSKLVSLDQDL
jgi:hypothetical protein